MTWNIHDEWEKADTRARAFEYALVEYAAELDSRTEARKLMRFVDKIRSMPHEEITRRLDSTKLSWYDPDAGPFFVEYSDVR